MRLKEQPSRVWRWIALVMVLINVSFNYFSTAIISGPSVAEVSAQYPSLFTPAGYAFAIWGLIYFSFVVYAIYQLLPHQRRDRLYDQLAQPFILSNLFTMCWVTSFRMNIIWLSMIFVSCLLITAMMMYTRVRHSILRDEYSSWLSVPFSLFAGWLSVATIANASLVFISQGLQGDISNQVIWSTILILFSAVLGLFVCFRCRDFIFPAVISWACVGIFVAQQNTYPYVGIVAIAGALIPLAWMTTTWVKGISYRHKVWGNKLSFSDSFIAKARRQSHKLV